MNHKTTTHQLIQAVEDADSADGLLSAVEELADACDPAAISTLITVLGYNNPGAAVAAVDGLIALGETAIPSLLELIDTYNYGARAWAVRACAGIGDPRTLDLLLTSASSDFSQSVRRAAARGLGIIRWEKLSPEKANIAQNQALETLLLVCQDGEWIVRYAAVVGLQELALSVMETRPDVIEKISTQFQFMVNTDDEIAVVARVQMALGKISNISC